MRPGCTVIITYRLNAGDWTAQGLLFAVKTYSTLSKCGAYDMCWQVGIAVEGPCRICDLNLGKKN